MKRFFRGSHVEAVALFVDETGRPYDPVTVSAWAKPANGEWSALPVQREAMGQFKALVRLSSAGLWTIRFLGQGPVDVAVEETVLVLGA